MSYPKSLEGKVALIVGGAGAIGAATGRLLARDGATVVVTHLPGEAAAKAAAGLVAALPGAGHAAYPADVADTRTLLELRDTLAGRILLHTVAPQAISATEIRNTLAAGASDAALAPLLPGAVLAWLLWLAAVWGYTVYLRAVPSFSITYGSLGGIIVTLFFFYISALLFIFGAELNSVLRMRNEKRLESRVRALTLSSPGRRA